MANGFSVRRAVLSLSKGQLGLHSRTDLLDIGLSVFALGQPRRHESLASLFERRYARRGDIRLLDCEQFFLPVRIDGLWLRLDVMQVALAAIWALEGASLRNWYFRADLLTKDKP